MAKIKIKTTLKTKENIDFFEVLGIKNNNRYSYIENDCKVVIDIIDDCVKMIRKKNDYELEFWFMKKGNSKLLIKLENNTINMPIKTNELSIDEKQIFVVYKIDNDIFKYIIQFVGDTDDNK